MGSASAAAIGAGTIPGDSGMQIAMSEPMMQPANGTRAPTPSWASGRGPRFPTDRRGLVEPGRNLWGPRQHAFNAGRQLTCESNPVSRQHKWNWGRTCLRRKIHAAYRRICPRLTADARPSRGPPPGLDPEGRQAAVSRSERRQGRGGGCPRQLLKSVIGEVRRRSPVTGALSGARRPASAGLLATTDRGNGSVADWLEVVRGAVVGHVPAEGLAGHVRAAVVQAGPDPRFDGLRPAAG